MISNETRHEWFINIPWTCEWNYHRRIIGRSNQNVPFCAERTIKELTSTALQGFCSLSLILPVIVNIGTCVRGKKRHEIKILKCFCWEKRLKNGCFLSLNLLVPTNKPSSLRTDYCNNQKSVSGSCLTSTWKAAMCFNVFSVFDSPNVVTGI